MARLKDSNYKYVLISSTTDEEKLEYIPFPGVRHYQILLTSCLVFLSYGIRISPSVAIVAMTDPNASNNPNIPTYPQWTEKSIVLSSFFWGYAIPQIFAGWLVSQYGTKWCLITTMGICAFTNLLIPSAAALFGSKGVMVCRIVQGLCQGFFSPSIHHLLSQWVPVSERSRLGPFVYAAGPLGTVACMLFAGIMSASYLGWPWIFYFYGMGGICWCIVSLIFGANSPSAHLFISENERFLIEQSLGHTERDQIFKTPWKEIATSVPVWALLITHCGHTLGFYGLLTETPNYIHHVMGFIVESSSFVSALPYALLWVLSIALGAISDCLINRGILSIGEARKVFNSIGLIIPAITLVLLENTPSTEPNKAIFLLILAVGFNAGTYCGLIINHVDLSPNHGSTLMGITNGISTLFGLSGPLLVQFLVKNEKDPMQWKIVFNTFAVLYILASIVFNSFASGEIQPWNEKKIDKKDDALVIEEENIDV